MKVKYITREDAIHCDIPTSKEMLRELISDARAHVYIIEDLGEELNDFVDEYILMIPRKPTLVRGYVAVEGRLVIN